MSYKWTSGSVRRGDIYAQEDTTGDATYIDWGQDTITFKPGDDATMFLEEGKVGIGTTSPTYTLDVVGDIGIDSLLRHNDDSNTYLRFLNDGFDVVVGGVKSINCDPSATRINAQNADHDFVVQTSGSPGLEDAFFVEGSSGKVGIGTDTPTAVLHVSGSDAAALFSVRSDSNIDLLVVTGSGKVGIGTPDPQTTLHVKSDPGQFRVEDTTVDYAYTIDCDGAQVVTHFGDLTDGESGKDAFMSFGAYGGINRLDTASRDFHLYGTRTTVGFYFDESSGSFGFGTTTPGSTLDISGSVSFNVTVFTANATLDGTHHVAVADCNAAAVTLTLPEATAAITGRQYIIKRADSSNSDVNACAIAPAGGDAIDGGGSLTSIEDGTSHTLICIGNSGWIIVDKYVGGGPP